MLVLSRKLNEQIYIDEKITVTVLGVRGKTVRIGIDAPATTRILRGELAANLVSESSVNETEKTELMGCLVV